jgi:hypothetical protein
MAPLGAYLMLAGFVLAVFLVFSFVCLPMGADKVRLRKSLFWCRFDESVSAVNFSDIFFRLMETNYTKVKKNSLTILL